MFYTKIKFLKNIRPIRVSFGLLSSASLCTVLLSASLFSSGLAAAACSNTPDPSQGTVTQTINVVTAGTYTIWSRMMAPDTTNNSYYLQIDGGCAFNVGDSSSIPANSWTWVNYQNGTTNSPITANLTAGNHQIVMTGREGGVGLDKVLFLTDSTCVPNDTKGIGTNCTPTTVNAPPTVSITSPSSGATVNAGSVPMTANASDDTSVASVAFAVDGTTVSTDTTSPYSANWDASKATAGSSHTITAKATDAGGLSTTAQETVKIAAATQPPPPTVSLSAPSAQATVSGTTNISVTASSSVKNVQFKLDGANLGAADTASPFTYSWDTTKVTNGTHTLSAVASDGTNSVTAANVTVTVNNQPVTPPVTVSLSAPANNATVSGATTAVSATASSGTTSVQFKLDGANLGSADTAAPYTATWDTTKVANGAHTLSAVASNGTSTATATNVNVTVNNKVVTPPPTISLSAPTNNATVSGTTPVSATASSGTTSVQFKLDGANLGSADTTSPYSYSWDTTKVNNGSHTLTAVASDGTNTATSSTVSVNINNTVVQAPGTVQNLAWSSTTKSLTWTAYPGASSYVVAQVHNPTTTRNTDYTWPHVTGTTCTPGSSTCVLPLPSSGETVNYGIIPLDSTGNPVSGSTWAKEITVTWPTATTSDTTPPSQPTGLTANAASSSQINLAWAASTDNVGVTGYKVYRAGSTASINSATLISTVTTNSYGDSGLAANTKYTYYVVAVDKAGNQSTASATASTTTQAASSTITIKGTATNSSTHKPVSGVHVYTDSSATANGAASALTATDGTYTLSNITPGKHTYYIRANGYRSQTYYNVTLPATLNVENISLTPSSRH
jgi:hypothetical protein